MGKEDSIGENTVGAYLNEISKFPYLSEHEEVEICKRLTEVNTIGCEKLREQLFQSYLHYVVSIAKKHIRPNIQLLDLIQEGNIGLLYAAEHYVYRPGVKFVTYALPWIRQSIFRYIIKNERPIRLSEVNAKKLWWVSRTEEDLYKKLGRKPTDKEIAKELHMKPEKIEKLKTLSYDNINIESIVDDKGNIFDTIADDRYKDPTDMINRNILRGVLVDSVKGLNPREQKTITGHYGLGDGGEVKSLEEVGLELGNISRERVRQIESVAIKKLRNPKRTENLKVFLEN